VIGQDKKNAGDRYLLEDCEGGCNELIQVRVMIAKGGGGVIFWRRVVVWGGHG